MKLYHNLFCRDIEAQLRFYSQLLGVGEALHLRSPIYRGIEMPGFQFGFHAPAAYRLLQLEDRVPDPASHQAVTGYPTFMLDNPDTVTNGAGRASELGGRVIKAPYATYYGQWQAVLGDPEGHVFRLSCDALPAGVSVPILQLEQTPA